MNHRTYFIRVYGVLLFSQMRFKLVKVCVFPSIILQNDNQVHWVTRVTSSLQETEKKNESDNSLVTIDI